MSVKRLAVALCAAAMATGTGTAYAQDVTGSLGTVQVAVPEVTVDASAAAPTTADVNDGVASAPVATVGVTTHGRGGSQRADNSTGTVQAGGGGSQSARNSVGTVQAAVPDVTLGASASTPSSVDVNNGAATEPRIGLDAAADPGPGGPQSADDSTGTVQIGGGGDQTAHDSVGTAQIAYPGFGLEALLGLPMTADLNDGVSSDPGLMLAVLLEWSGGSQTADNSTGTVQVGGGGPQTATDSTGTVQAAVPSVDAAAAGSDSSVDAAVVTTPSGGSQTADNSTGTVQIGGGGASAGATTPAGGSSSPAAPGATTATSPSAGVLPATPLVRTPAASTAPAAAPRKSNVNPREFTTVARAAQLPFTGAALLPALLLGLALLGLGLTMRRRCLPLT